LQVHLNSNIAADRAQILFALDCPSRASSMVTLVPKNHATAAWIGLPHASAAPSDESLLQQQLLCYCGRCTVSHASTAATAVGSSRLQVVLWWAYLVFDV